MAAHTSHSVSDYELAVLVLNYLESNECTKTASSFKREGKKLFGTASQTNPTGVMTLSQILNEYVRLKSIDLQRECLRQSNPVVQSLYQVLDYHAGLPSQPQPQAPPLQAPMFHPTQQMQVLAEQPVLAAATGAAPSINVYIPNGGQQTLANELVMSAHGMVPLADFGGMHAPLQDNIPSIPADKPPQITSPGRHALRKRAPPKRRKLETAFNNGAPQQPTGGPILPIITSPRSNMNSPPNHASDFLYQTMDPQKLEALLTDVPLQSQFAHGMAQRLTEVMSHRPEGLLEMDNSLAFDDLFDDEDMMKIMANLVTTGSEKGAEGSIPQSEGQGAAQQQHQQQQQLVREAEENADGDGKSGGAMAAEGGLPPDIEEAVARYKENPEEFDDLIDACVG